MMLLAPIFIFTFSYRLLIGLKLTWLPFLKGDRQLVMLGSMRLELWLWFSLASLRPIAGWKPVILSTFLSLVESSKVDMVCNLWIV